MTFVVPYNSYLACAFQREIRNLSIRGTQKRHIMMKAKEAKCFVFIDLETHHLYSPKITEICMVAVTREHIIDAHKNQAFSAPRVLNKLSICVSPEVAIHPTAAEITGLTNQLLEEYPAFNAQTGTMISTFIDLLPKPVCMVAHNGLKFDFPVLKNALRKVNQDMPEHLRVGDTLPAFKKILKSWSLNPNGPGVSGLNSIKPLNGTTVESDATSILNESDLNGRDVINESNGAIATNAAVESNTSITVEGPNPNEWGNDEDDHMLAQMDLEGIVADAEEQYYLSQAVTVSDIQQSCSQLSWSPPVQETPKRPRMDDEVQSPDVVCLDVTDPDIEENARGEPFTSTPVAVRKDLFVFTEPTSYRLEDIYRKLRGSKPVGHRAEADVLSMLECVLVVGPEMLDYFDENSIPFADVQVAFK